MKREIALLKEKDWSLNLEDEVFADNPQELIEEAVKAVEKTGFGHYVNLVTPAGTGHPEQGLLKAIQDAIDSAGFAYREIVYVDECGCGGFVSRVYR
jgi:hypothetical protein